jgi:hypothetical protein
VPLETEVAERLDLVESLLDAILAEAALTGGRGLTNEVRAKCLGNGDELNVFGIAVGAMRRRTEAAAHGVEAFGNVRARRHCYLIMASIAFAVSAY